MENKTAVEWLIEQIKDDQFKKVKTDLQWSKIFEQAKEMEKEQIEDAFQLGKWNGYDNANGLTDLIDPSQYYNETYKSQ